MLPICTVRKDHFGYRDISAVTEKASRKNGKFAPDMGQIGRGIRASSTTGNQKSKKLMK